MNLPALISTAACAVTLFVGFWHLLVYYRGAGERTQLAFALTCFAIGLYDICSIGGYLTTSLEWSGAWGCAEQASGALFGVPFVWFLVLTTRRRLNWFASVVSAYFSAVALLVVLAPVEWTLTDVPRITHVTLPAGIQVVYHEVQHGPLLAIVSGVSSLVILVVIGVALLSFPRETEADRVQARFVQFGIAAFLLGALNDIAVSRQLYSSLYVMEVAYLGLVLAVTWGMSNAVLELAVARAELRREHDRMKRIFDSVNEVYVETTADGTIREISPSFYRLTGAEGDVRGRLIQDFYADASQRSELLRQLRARGRVNNFAARVCAREGRTLDGEISAVMTRDEVTGEVLIHGSIRDVTARRRAEEGQLELERQLQQAQKLESLGVLAGGIAHDFNNLLAAIMGSLELVKLKVGDQHPAQQVLDLGLQSGHRAAELSRLMLAYSGKGQFVVESLDLTTFVRGMHELLTISATRRVRLDYALSDEPLVVEADASQLSQVLLNLVINAAEAMGKHGGRIRVATSSVDCSEDELRSEYLAEPGPPGRYVALEVEDDGEGMDEETKRRLFDPFFSTKFSGRGLGLSAVLGIVRAHGGAIHVESGLGQGTNVRILLPASANEVVPTPGKPSEKATWRGEGDALLIDDEVAVLDIVGQMLQTLGFRVTALADSKLGLERFHETPHRFAVVVVDKTMPGLCGEDVLEQMRGLRGDLPAVLISGYSSEEDSPPAAIGRHTSFVQKPFSLDNLRDALRDVLE